MDKHISLLVVEDNENDFLLLQDSLESISLKNEIVWVESFEKAKDLLATKNFDIALIDYRLGHTTGLEIISYINEHFTMLPVILLTGISGSYIDEKALQAGAFDCLNKDQYSTNSLDKSIRYTLEKAKVLKSFKESENKFRNIFENAVDYLFIIDSNYIIQDINKSALAMLEAVDKSNVIGKSISDLLKVGSVKQPFNFLVHHNRLDSYALKEIEITAGKSNRRYHCILNVFFVDSEEKIIQIVLHDITDRKLNENREKILEKQALTGKVARVIAHEIKNPLTNIQLSLEELKVMLEGVRGKDTDEPNEFLDIIDRNSKRINQLTEDLLNSTRFDTMELKEMFLEDIIEGALSMVCDRIKLKEVALVKELEKGLCIKADKEKMTIAFTNILINAIEAMKIEEGRLMISTSKRGNEVVMVIRDNGSGIPPEHMSRLFEPFFTSKPEGTGLGLSATYSIITKHDGEISVESKVGEGTSFTITFSSLEKLA